MRSSLMLVVMRSRSKTRDIVLTARAICSTCVSQKFVSGLKGCSKVVWWMCIAEALSLVRAFTHAILIKPIPTATYRLLKHHLPGPYTFILNSSKEVPRVLKSKKDTVGLRIPDNLIARSIVKELGHPILSVSLPGDMVEEYTDPELIHRNFESKVDLVIDGGVGGMVPSTIIDCTGDEPVVTRHGLGEWETVH